MTPRPGLERLLVLDRLEVGPVRLDRRGLRAPYRLTVGGETSETVLSCRYEEDVFDPGDPVSANLAAMIAAQVALNYGLFTGEIVFRGPFDAADRAFLAEMATNTAREIYVNKILRPNPLLVPEARDVPPARHDSYLQAELRFEEDGTPSGGPAASGRAPRWSRDRGAIAVLSSGGKESLLSYGLLREIGLDVHSLFVNESGRHWYTALNGYRYLNRVDPERTGRVWTSADRVFSWMARQLPLVRPDVSRIRADDYPIRLWTVAVFLFGALPLLRARGIGRIVIGDEFDTTRIASHEGITHYDGLYDQSRFFDNALSGYFRRKGWNVAQFSVLRPLSELLVEKILVERYPELQAQQVSCHAASVKGDRAYPCGRCEKCRRVVSMLVAVSGDPARCGYAAEQVDACLRAVATGELHQEAENAEHVRWLLRESGRLPAVEGPALPARPHPEVTSLRFDERHSPPQAVPLDLRRPLLGILLEHAEGALRRSGRRWIPWDLLNDPGAWRPYRFEAASAEPGRDAAGAAPSVASAGGRTGARDWKLGELTWPEAERRLAETDVALFPVGAVEQHGPHLPLDTDAWDAEALCADVAERCARPRPLVLPAIPYGVSYHHQDFPGTLSVDPETLARIVYEVGISAARHGITKLVIVNGHGGNLPTLQFAAQMINRDAHIFTCVDTGETSDADIARLTETAPDLHAGEVETSTTLAKRPHLVDMEKAEAFVPRSAVRYLDFSSEYGVEWFAHTARLSPSGVLGDPTKASVEKGERMWEVMVGHLVSFVETLKSMTLAEIHERRT
jgi:creatinine amidohydrolase/Fe(II)-dependent formamide hydrolase-like protein